MNINLAAGNSGYSTIDLILLLLGLRTVATPNAMAKTGEEYYLSDEKSVKLSWNEAFFTKPPWDSSKEVKYKDWLIANLIFNDTELKNDFSAVPISDLLAQSFDLSSIDISGINSKYNIGGKSITEDGKSFKSGLSLAYGFVDSGTHDKKLLIIGFGFHRSVSVDASPNHLTLSLETFVPCVTFQTEGTAPFIKIKQINNSDPKIDPVARSIQSGISLTSENLDFFKSIKNLKFKTKYGIRFNVLSSIGAIKGSETSLNFDLGNAVFGAATQNKGTNVGEENFVPGTWEHLSSDKKTYKTIAEWESDSNYKDISSAITSLVKSTGLNSTVSSFLKIIYDAPFSPILPISKEGVNSFGHFNDAKELFNNLRTSEDGWKNAIKSKAKEKYNESFGKTYPKVKPSNPIPPPSTEVKGTLLKNAVVTVAQFLGNSYKTDQKKIVLTKGMGLFKISPGGYSPLEKGEFDPKEVIKSFETIIDGFPLIAKYGGGIKSGLGLKIGIYYLLKLASTNKGHLSADDLKKNLVSSPTAKLLTLATRQDENIKTKTYLGLRAQYNDIILKRPPKDDVKTPAGPAGKSSMINPYEIQFQLGKWLSPGNDMDNWYSRLICRKNNWKAVKGAGQPGLGIYPFAYDSDKKSLGMDWRFGLVSAGVDIYGVTERGLINIADRFKISGIEVRGLFAADVGLNPKNASEKAFTFGFAVLLAGVSLDLSAEAPKSGLEGNMQKNLGSSLQHPPDKPLPDGADEQTDLSKVNARYITQLSKKVNSYFSLELGYLHDIEGNGTFDFQLYDAEGKRGKLAWLPLERKLGPFYFHAIGVGFSGMELHKPTLTLVLTGGMKFSNFELGLIGAGVSFPLHNPSDLTPVIMGLEMAANFGSIKMMAGFMKYVNSTTTQYMGEVRVETPALMIAGMGAYGKFKDTGDITLFLYAAMSAKDGAGIGNAIIKITGFALGFGVNRKVIPPAFNEIGEFPLVSLVMGKPPAPEVTMDDVTQKSLDPTQLLNTMTSSIVAAEGHYFGAVGLQFTLVDLLDCFALGILQFAPKDVEITLLGIGRLQFPKVGRPFVYVELGIKADIHPTKGSFEFSMGLTNNSWVFQPNIHLTGGFAFSTWTLGEHAGDSVYTMGGYHPSFSVPAHYPSVPRVGFNLSLSGALAVKGGLYYAVTPGACMAGIRMEANFHESIITAHFDAHADMLMKFAPFHYDVSAGIHISVDVDLFFSISFSAGVDLHIWGPPMGGRADIHAAFDFSISFGSQPADQKVIGSWSQFGRGFVDQLTQGGEKANANDSGSTGKWSKPTTSVALTSGVSPIPAVAGPSICNLQLRKGSLAGQGGKSQSSNKKAPWFVRGDELVMSVATILPAKNTEVGTFSNKYGELPAEGSNLMGLPQTLSSPLTLNKTAKQESATGEIGIVPMGIQSVHASDLKVTIINDETPDAPYVDNLADWTIKFDIGNKQSGVWGTHTGSPSVADAAKMVKGCITGIRKISPPKGGPSINKDGYEINGEVFKITDILEPGMIDIPDETVSNTDLTDGSDYLTNSTLNTKIKDSKTVHGNLFQLGILKIESEVLEKYNETPFADPNGHWKTLGISAWKNGGPPLPAQPHAPTRAWDKHWTALSDTELEAAKALGFDFYSWDERFTIAGLGDTPAIGALFAAPMVRG